MAEGLCRRFLSDTIDPSSAGIESHGLDPLAVKAMGEIDIDISNHQSKTTLNLGNREFDYVITLCNEAEKTCPFFPARTKVIHRGFDDPPKLAEGATNEEEALRHYRRVRDEIKDYILDLTNILSQG